MKISIAISLLILAAAAVIGWNNRQRIQVVSETHRSLVAEAAALGLSIDTENPEGVSLATKREREDKAAQARLVAKELIAFAIETEKLRESGEQPGESMRKRTAEFMDKMLSLDAGQLKIVISEFRANEEMKEQTRTGMIAFAIMTLASDHPEVALTLFTESEGMFDNDMVGNHLLSNSLASWASKDAGGALEWVRKNGEKHPDLITDEVKAGLVKGAASNSLALGCDLLGELKLENSGHAINSLAGAVGSPAERTEFLMLYREYLKTASKADRNRSHDAMHRLAAGIVKDGFDEGSRWIRDNELTEEEIESLAGNIGLSSNGGEKGQWIEWMGENLPDGHREPHIESVVRNWTQNDYRAAGEWLAEAPPSPAKTASIAAYAETVAPHDPQTAAQWALTLPPGETRKQTLESVYESWPQDDPTSKAAREAFMAEHPAE